MEIHIGKNEEETLASLAGFFIAKANESIRRQGAFNVSLSGGGSPKRLYQMLSMPPYSNQTLWDKVCFFFGDERYVPFDDPASNGLMVKKALFDPLQIRSSQIFYIETSMKPADAAVQYEERMAAHFNKKPVRFDLILLGLGDNSHTASLFPSTPVLSETNAAVRAVYVKEQETYRITMTAPLLNQAKCVAFLVYGENKAEAVFNVLEGKRDMQLFPAQLIHPDDGELHWFIDEMAALKLESPS